MKAYGIPRAPRANCTCGDVLYGRRGHSQRTTRRVWKKAERSRVRRALARVRFTVNRRAA